MYGLEHRSGARIVAIINLVLSINGLFFAAGLIVVALQITMLMLQGTFERGSGGPSPTYAILPLWLLVFIITAFPILFFIAAVRLMLATDFEIGMKPEDGVQKCKFWLKVVVLNLIVASVGLLVLHFAAVHFYNKSFSPVMPLFLPLLIFYGLQIRVVNRFEKELANLAQQIKVQSRYSDGQGGGGQVVGAVGVPGQAPHGLYPSTANFMMSV